MPAGEIELGKTYGVSYVPKRVSMNHAIGGTPKCPRCNQPVYFNEKKDVLGKSYHKRCVTCKDCNKSLDTHNLNDHEGELYCTLCHRKNFGTRGYGFAAGGAGLSAGSYTKAEEVKPTQIHTAPVPCMLPAKVDSNNANNCATCGKVVYTAEMQKAEGKKYHKLCFKCSVCNRQLQPGRNADCSDGSLLCQPCYGRQRGPVGYGYAMGNGGIMSAGFTKVEEEEEEEEEETIIVTRL